MKEKGQQSDHSELKSEEEKLSDTENSSNKFFYKWEQKYGLTKGKY